MTNIARSQALGATSRCSTRSPAAGARRMIAVGLWAEADEYVERFADAVDEDRHQLVVRNGRAREREVTVGVGHDLDPGAARER